MAFYSYKSSNYDYDYDHGYDYAPAPSEASSQYSSPYEYGEPELLGNKSSAYYYRDDDSVATPESNYSVYTSPEPQILQYDPTEYRYSHNYSEYYSVNPSDYSYGEPKHLPYETKFLISYSKVEFNEPEFEEYDPTPYGGGYDPVSTYGKPLPPSETTCYPRSMPRSSTTSSESFSYASIPSPYGKDDGNGDIPKKPSNVAKPIDAKTDTETCVGNGDKGVVSDGVDVETVGGDSMPEGYENGVEKVTGGDYDGGESERQMHYIPYGSGLETIDICESIFGYWPCLAKIEQQQKRSSFRKEEERRNMDPWKSAADYLFGGPEPVVVYDYDNYHHHHQQQAEYEYHSWLQ